MAKSNVTSAARTAGQVADTKARAAAAKTVAPKPSAVAKNIVKPTVQPKVTPAAAPGGTMNVNTPPAASPILASLQNIFAPLQANLAAQQKATQDRYAANQADIKNIFGNLSTIREADKVKIADQFKQSIMDQQAALAGRTAEARQATAAGAAGAAQAGAELGGGPATMPTDSLSAQAAEQGIAGANQVQSNWEGLQNAMQAQTQQNLQNAITGYGFQQAQAVQDLGKSFQDKMSGLASQSAQIDSQIAQAQNDYNAAVASNDFKAAQDALDRKNALDVAKTTAASRVAVQKLKNTNGGGTAAPKATGIDAWYQAVGNLKTSAGKPIDPSAVIDSVNAAVASAAAYNKKVAAKSTNKTVKPVTQAQVISRLTSTGKGSALPKAIQYVQQYSGLKK